MSRRVVRPELGVAVGSEIQEEEFAVPVRVEGRDV